MNGNAIATLGYQSGSDLRSDQKRWLGVTSLIFWGVTTLVFGVCFVEAKRASGWDGLDWFVYGFLISWIGCGIGALFALIGYFPRRRRHRFALAGLILNLLTGLGPITVVWVDSALS